MSFHDMQWKLEIGETLDGIVWKGPHVSMKAKSNALVEFPGEKRGDIHCEKWEFEKRRMNSIGHCAKYSSRLISDVFEHKGLHLTRQIEFGADDLSSFHIRIVIGNVGNRAVKLLRLTPISVQDERDLIVGAEGAREWLIYTSCRLKNGLPCTQILGELTKRHLTSSSAAKHSSALISDVLTVLKGNRGKGPGSLLLGFIDNISQLAECKISIDPRNGEFRELEASNLLDGILLEPGQKSVGEWMRVDGDEDALCSIERFARLKSIESRTSPQPNPPSVFCTWYYYGSTVGYDDVLKNLEALVKLKLPIDIFQIDDGWERNWGDWTPNPKFPFGMKHLAEKIRSHGCRPGIWTCPFLIDPECELRRAHPAWLLRDHDEEPVRFVMGDRDNYVLDTTHPEVLKWIEDLYRKLTHRWGYSYHKIDFTRAVAINPNTDFFDKKATRAEAYRRGLSAIRKGTGSEAYVLVCGGLYGPSSGLVNGQRTSSDVIGLWDSTRKDNNVTPRTIRQNVLRYWMNALWHNDPDALMVRRRKNKFRNVKQSLGLLSDDEARVFTLNQYFGGGIICFSEPLHEIERDRLGLLRHVVPSLGTSAVPRDIFSGAFPRVYDTLVKPMAKELPEWHTVAFVNWSTTPVKAVVTLDESIVGRFAKGHKRYSVSEFWSRHIWNSLEYGDTIDLGTVNPHSAKLLKIMSEDEGKPVLLYSNGHFSMGGTEITKWQFQQERLLLRVDWPWYYPVDLVVRSPNGRRWTVKDRQYQSASQDRKKLRIRLHSRFKGNIELRLTL